MPKKPFWDDPKALSALRDETSSPAAIRLEREVHAAFKPFLKYKEEDYREEVDWLIDHAPSEIWRLANRLAKKVTARGMGPVAMMEVLLRIGAVLAVEDKEKKQ